MTREQVQKLEKAYALDRNLWGSTKRMKLSKSLGLTDIQVLQWFYQRRLKDKKKKIANAKLIKSSKQEMKVQSESSSSSESDSGNIAKSKLVKSSRQKLMVGSGSSSSSESDSSQSNGPMEFASQQPLPQTKTPTEIDSRIEKTRIKIKTRVEKEVKTRVASHVDSLRVEMEDKMKARNVNLKNDVFESCKQKLMYVDRCVGVGSNGGSGVGVSVGGGGSGAVGGSGNGCGGDGDIKNKIISMLTERNKRDKAKYDSLSNEIACLGKSIEATDKLIDDIKEVC